MSGTEQEHLKIIKIIVATHKKYWMPDESMYIPVQAGAVGKEDMGYVRDDGGDNISEKNPYYCELTCLYWAWKNLESDYLGLVHYRRHFMFNRLCRKPINERQASCALRHTNVLLPKARHYWIETNYSQYAHAHHAVDLDCVRQIIAERCPEYLSVFDSEMKRTHGHRFNIFIMRRDLADAYCQWLFEILFELERRLDITDYSENDRRVFGFVGERLLDVWLNTNHVGYRELSYLYLEKQNWLLKCWSFLKRKLK